VMALERVPADIRKFGGVCTDDGSRIIKSIMKSVSIPVMAKVRIGHFAEAQILSILVWIYIDESEVLTQQMTSFISQSMDLRSLLSAAHET